MSLKPGHQLYSLNIDHVTLNTSERGGILCLGSASGITIAEYAIDPANKIPLGIQWNDVENIDLSRQIHPRHAGRRVDFSMSTVGIMTDGEVTTDWLSISGLVGPGSKAYVGPSGTITDCADYGGARIGIFLSTVKSDPHTVVFAGLGFSREYMDFSTKTLMMENDPADRILVVTPGFATIRIDQAYSTGKAG